MYSSVAAQNDRRVEHAHRTAFISSVICLDSSNLTSDVTRVQVWYDHIRLLNTRGHFRLNRLLDTGPVLIMNLNNYRVSVFVKSTMDTLHEVGRK